ncbi:DUF4232 domain-containing protein [Streptomyces sp. SID486]|uniref:DUF4232 domain-containing protein n=1 Tax=unclassified Streptomyces TaxID=2593676 RepID=UPI0013721F52|nr:MULTISPECIES: DUF4232 domain-containing protein [unclassified Streptomyces]MYW20237.1 DUF4232 domain-containing protein [Streptomyces sp. SID2955]MYW46240.1 DUF4232 domain-containing protein [Streptomyces sp. SID161]MYX95474.1 DUF4232 domain-containing protein [Streptomyces sp. SID486]
MRVIPLTVTALAAALLLTACDDGGGKNGDSADSACKIGGVSLQIGSASVAPAAGDSGEIPVSITNQSAPCTLEDFPAVTLSTGDAEKPVPVLKGAKPQKLKLAKGDSASFSISYVRGKDGDGKAVAAKDVKISLPGADTGQSYPWKYGPVAGKADGSGPDASVSAFQQVGD